MVTRKKLYELLSLCNESKLFKCSRCHKWWYEIVSRNFYWNNKTLNKMHDNSKNNIIFSLQILHSWLVGPPNKEFLYNDYRSGLKKTINTKWFIVYRWCIDMIVYRLSQSIFITSFKHLNDLYFYHNEIYADTLRMITRLYDRIVRSCGDNKYPPFI